MANRIVRFSKSARRMHWVNTISFFVLLLTGLPIYIESLSFLASIFGGVQSARVIHRIFSVIFLGYPIIAYLTNMKAANEFLKDVFTLDKDSIAFLKVFPRELFGLHAKAPAQGKYNGGEKVNSILTILGGIILACSGFILWFSAYFPVGIVQFALPIHDLAMILCTVAVIGHIYLALLHPSTKEAINGMVNGTVDEEFAKSHYGKWYEEVKKNSAN